MVRRLVERSVLVGRGMERCELERRIVVRCIVVRCIVVRCFVERRFVERRELVGSLVVQQHLDRCFVVGRFVEWCQLVRFLVERQRLAHERWRVEPSSTHSEYADRRPGETRGVGACASAVPGIGSYPTGREPYGTLGRYAS